MTTECPLLLDSASKQRLEREYYYKQKEAARLSKVRQEMESIPRDRQCHRYRWRQSETTFDVEIPMHTSCDEEDLWLVVEKDHLQVAMKRDDSFGAITVGSCLTVDGEHGACSTFRVMNLG